MLQSCKNPRTRTFLMQNLQRIIAESARRRILFVIPARTRGMGGVNVIQLFGGSPQEVQLWRGRHHDISEVEQMCNRVKYITLSYQFTEEERREVDPCGHCGDKLYAKGLTASAALPLDATCRCFKRKRSAVATVQELTALRKLKGERALDADEYMRLKHKLLEESL